MLAVLVYKSIEPEQERVPLMCMHLHVHSTSLSMQTLTLSQQSLTPQVCCPLGFQCVKVPAHLPAWPQTH